MNPGHLPALQLLLDELAPGGIGALLQIGGSGPTAPDQLRAAVSPRTHVVIDPGDTASLAVTLDEQLGGEPLDLVVDDGSHRYGDARAAFEVAFPRLRPGGRYVLCGWSWAHTDPPPEPAVAMTWVDEEPALTNLVVELVLLAGTDERTVASLAVERGAVVAVRGDADLGPSFQLAGAYRNRGLRFRPLL